ISRIGRLLRDAGRWDGAELVPAWWVRRMHHPFIDTGRPSPFQRYGLAVWDGPGQSWRLDGLYGQYVIVHHRYNAVVTITAHEENRDYLLAKYAERALREA
ncbi:MAG TPA: hypothetical protein VGC05_23390, partial [Mycobacterium sp.]